eukprot:symbB.v1.2.025573.t1/scaffold2413.1/size174923/14
MDPEEACQCASHCSSRKVVLLYYLGPSMAVASLCPRGDASKIYEVRIQEDTVIVYLNDACELFLQELGPGRFFEVNLMLQTKQSQQQAPKEPLSEDESEIITKLWPNQQVSYILTAASFGSIIFSLG